MDRKCQLKICHLVLYIHYVVLNIPCHPNLNSCFFFGTSQNTCAQSKGGSSYFNFL